MAVCVAAVGVAAELSVVGQPGVGGFDYPAQSEVSGLSGLWGFGAAALDAHVVKAQRGEPVAHYGVVLHLTSRDRF